MARPIKGAVRWVDAKSLWEVRFTLANGARSRPMVLLRGPPGKIWAISALITVHPVR